MKRIFLGVVVLVLSVIAVSSVWAGGDKVRGEEGQGAVNQVDFNNQGKQN